VRKALINGRALIGGELISGRVIVIDDGRIAAIAGEVPSGCEAVDLQGGILAPGFIDTQVNGGGDRLFNDDPSVETIAAIGAAHRAFGTTGFLPTLISDDAAKTEAAMEAVRAAIAAGVPGVLGVHIEGPFLNPERKGIHDGAKLREISEADIKMLSRPTGGRTLVTLAPERVPGDAIRALAGAGVIVSIGHTQASAAQVEQAIANGVTGFTHLFNAMSQITPREPGTVGAALGDGASWCGIIVDGHHVDPRVLRLAMRAAPLDRFMLVTDAMPSVGGRKSFVLGGQPIAVVDGKCTNADGTIAGSDLDMASAVRNAVGMLGLGLPNALAMASANPAAFLGLSDQLGSIAEGYRADLVLLDTELEVVETWIAGAPTVSR
jgi:N-acetylglucosamine-6-phosphate deacetylase